MRLPLPSPRLAARLGLSILAVFLVLTLVALERTVWLRGSLADLGGSLRVEGLGARVTIRRDGYGIPHIRGESQADVYFGLGFAHAQDRLWQMELGRRAAQGRLAEILGARALDVDLYFRTANFDALSKASFKKLSPNAQAVIAAYVQGINAYIASRQGPYAPEFGLLLVKPERWEAHHALVMLNAVAVGLSTNLGSELFRARLQELLSEEEIAEFLPPYPGDAPVAIRAAKDLEKIPAIARAHAALQALPPVGASNNWVLDGRHTRSGKPLLANDPHLGMSAPSVWYLAHLEAGGRHLVGASMPGVPAILLGRSGKAAWGFTNTGADVQDLYIEKVDPEDPGRYLTEAGSEPFQTREEIFQVRFGKPVTRTLRATRNGPVLPGGLMAIDAVAPGGDLLSLAWTAFTPENTTAEVALRAIEIESWESFNRLFADYIVPMQSIVFADTGGTIGLLAPGRAPLRAPGHPTRGLLPSLGGVEANRWQGFVPYEGLPRIKNPASGRIVTANHKIVPDDFPYFLTAEWDTPYRAQRIEALLKAREKHDVASMVAIQLDDISPLALEMLPHMLNAAPLGARAEAALALLTNWNGAYDRNRAEPLLFEAWHRAFAKAIYADELGDLFNGAWNHRPGFLMWILKGEPGAERWCDDRRTPDVMESCAEQLSGSLRSALKDLTRVYGRRMDRWRWGEAHPVIHAHRPFSLIPGLKALFEIRAPSDGGFFTVDRGANYFGGKEPFANVHAAGFRAVYDMADLDASLYMISTGQSGNVFSRHYGDLAKLWNAGDYVRIPTSEAAIAAAAVHTFVLEPE